MNAGEKTAYLKGLLDAGPITDPAVASAFKAAVEALEALAAENAELREQMKEQAALTEELYQICGDLDADLSDVESRLGITDDADPTFDDEYCEADCPACGLHFFCHSSMVDSDGTVECPDCGESFLLKNEPAPGDDESDG